MNTHVHAITKEDLKAINLGEPIYYGGDGVSETCSYGGSSGEEQFRAASIEEYTARYGETAFQLGKKHGIPYEVILAQSALESGWGGSGLTQNANNFFGIKAGESWDGPVYTTTTTEEVNGENVEVEAEFRSYANARAGFLGYVDLIYGASRYEGALEYPNDPKQYLQEVVDAGYATDSEYFSKVYGVVKDFQNHIAENDLFPPSSEVDSSNIPPTQQAAAGDCSGMPSGDFTHYDQGDEKWADYPLEVGGGEDSYMARGGCGPTAIAMVLANMYDDSITPVDVADYSNEHGYHTPVGSSWQLLSNAPEDMSNGALSVTDYGNNLDRALKVLEQGGLVMATGKNSPPPYTDGGHIIVIRESLGNGNFLVGDPVAHNPPDHEYSRDEIDNGRNYWGVTK